MPQFDYVGQLASGASFEGTLEADDQAAADRLLRGMGVRVTALRPAQRSAYVAPLSLDELTFFNEQLASLTKSGMPLNEGLRQLAADAGSRKLKRMLLDLAAEIEAGTALDVALEKQKGRFPAQYPQVVAAGLQTGDLAGTLYGMSTHLRLRGNVRRTLLELAAYPVMVLLMALLVTRFLMTSVIPALGDIVTDMVGGDMFGALPLLGQLAFRLADAWPWVELVCVGLLALVGLVVAGMFLPGMAATREYLLRSLPGFGGVYWSSILARFAHTSALAAHSGRPLPEIMRTAGQSTGSPALRAATDRVAQRVAEGAPLGTVASKERDLSPLWVCTVEVAGARGDLPAALAEIARMYELRAEQRVTTLRFLVGPLLLIFVAVVIGTILMSLAVTIAYFFQMVLW